MGSLIQLFALTTTERIDCSLGNESTVISLSQDEVRLLIKLCGRLDSPDVNDVPIQPENNCNPTAVLKLHVKKLDDTY